MPHPLCIIYNNSGSNGSLNLKFDHKLSRNELPEVSKKKCLSVRECLGHALGVTHQDLKAEILVINIL